MTQRFVQGTGPGGRPRLNGNEISGVPARFYKRDAIGGDICGLWIGGLPMYDVDIYDGAGRRIGSIGTDSVEAREMYNELRRILATDDIRA
jgi:hypothetical protein